MPYSRYESRIHYLVMRAIDRERSSAAKLLNLAKVDLPELRGFMFDLANCSDERLGWLRTKYRSFLKDRYFATQLESYRDELRLLWHSPKGIPHKDFEDFEEWRKARPNATPGEMICNRWLMQSETRLLAVWDKQRRELIPSPADLPAHLVYGCLLWGDHLSYCGNPKCACPWFIGTRSGQQYCSNECAWPAKKAAKLKWWKANRAKKLAVPRRTK
jgi:hypothetical protein